MHRFRAQTLFAAPQEYNIDHHSKISRKRPDLLVKHKLASPPNQSLYQGHHDSYAMVNRWDVKEQISRVSTVIGRNPIQVVYKIIERCLITDGTLHERKSAELSAA
jgi:hypothetical protein